jgi:hypothetical protein
MQLRMALCDTLGVRRLIVQAPVIAAAVDRPAAQLGDAANVPPAGNASRLSGARPGSPA